MPHYYPYTFRTLLLLTDHIAIPTKLGAPLVLHRGVHAWLCCSLTTGASTCCGQSLGHSTAVTITPGRTAHAVP